MTGRLEGADVARRPGVYRPDIDGLRAIAILFVVGYHVEVPGFSGGFVGVDVFFVISGFLITGLLFRELNDTGRIRWLAFYARRVRRLVPAAALMLLVVLVLAPLLLNPLGEQQGLAKSAIAAAGSASNYFFWRIAPTDYFGGPGAGTQVLLHTWSLSVEEQFYVAMPVAVWMALWSGRRLGLDQRRALLATCGLMTVASLGTAMWWGHSHPIAAFYAPVTRAYEFGVGALLALAPRHRFARSRSGAQFLSAVGVIGLAICLAMPLPTAGFPGAMGMLPVVSSALLIAAGSLSNNWASRALMFPPLVSLGRVSYGWYLWHWPMITMVSAYNLAPLTWGYRLFLAVLALAVATASYQLLEVRLHPSPTKRAAAAPRMHRTPGRTVLAGVTALAICAGTAGAVGLLARQLKTAPTWEPVAAQATDYPVLPPSCVAGSAGIVGTGSPCLVKRGAPKAGTLVVWGDSHAWQYLPAVMEASTLSPISVLAWTSSGCAPTQPAHAINTAGLEGAAADAVEACQKYNSDARESILSIVRAGEEVRVVLAARWPPYLGQAPISLADVPHFNGRVTTVLGSLLKQGLAPLVGELNRAGIRVDLMAPIPELVRPAPTCLKRTGWPRFDCNVSRAKTDTYQQSARDLLNHVVAAYPADTRLIDVTDALCDETTCYAESDGIVNYFDDDHLSATRSRALAEYFEPSIEALEMAARSTE